MFLLNPLGYKEPIVDCLICPIEWNWVKKLKANNLQLIDIQYGKKTSVMLYDKFKILFPDRYTKIIEKSYFNIMNEKPINLTYNGLEHVKNVKYFSFFTLGLQTISSSKSLICLFSSMFWTETFSFDSPTNDLYVKIVKNLKMVSSMHNQFTAHMPLSLNTSILCDITQSMLSEKSAILNSGMKVQMIITT